MAENRMTGDQSITVGRYLVHPTLLSDALPVTLSLESTNHCNLRCTHCGHTQFSSFQKGYAREELFDRIAPYLGPAPERIPQLSLSDFGEPLLSPKWWTLFSRARAIAGVRISFVTNAVLLDRHLERLDHPALDITISMDGASERTYGHFRGTGYFEKVVSNLTQLRDRELAGALPPSNRSFIVVLSRVNVHEMTAIVELAARLGIAVVIFSFQVFFDEARFQQESLYFAQDSYDRCLAAAVRRANELGVFVIHPDAFRSGMKVAAEELRRQWLWRDDRGHVRCGYVVNQCYVKFHGQVEACCVQDRHPIGNLFEDDFIDIWHGPYYRRLRQSFHTGQWTSVCQNCNAYQSVEVHHKQSHFVIPMRDSGELHSLPQPYRATELEAQYRAAISALSAQDGDRAQCMSALERLTMRDERLHQATNAIAVLWLLLEQTDKAVRLLRQGAAMAPDDPVIAFNLRQALSD